MTCSPSPGPTPSPAAPTPATHHRQPTTPPAQVTSQTDPTGCDTTFNYCVSAADGDCMNTATGNGLVTVTDPDGNYHHLRLRPGHPRRADRPGPAARSPPSRTACPTPCRRHHQRHPARHRRPPTATATPTTNAYDADGNTTSDRPRRERHRPATDDLPGYTAACRTRAARRTAEASHGACSRPGHRPSRPAGSSRRRHPRRRWASPTRCTTPTETSCTPPPASTSPALAAPAYRRRPTSFSTATASPSRHQHAISCTTTPPSQSLPCATINADGVVTQLAYDSAGDLSLLVRRPTATAASSPDHLRLRRRRRADQHESPDGNLTGANAGNYTTTTA